MWRRHANPSIQAFRAPPRRHSETRAWRRCNGRSPAGIPWARRPMLRPSRAPRISARCAPPPGFRRTARKPACRRTRPRHRRGRAPHGRSNDGGSRARCWCSRPPGRSPPPCRHRRRSRRARRRRRSPGWRRRGSRPAWARHRPPAAGPPRPARTPRCARENAPPRSRPRRRGGACVRPPRACRGRRAS